MNVSLIKSILMSIFVVIFLIHTNKMNLKLFSCQDFAVVLL